MIVFLASGLFVYLGPTRTCSMLFHVSTEELEQTLAGDLWWGRRLLLGIQSLFSPPQLVG